MQMNLVDTPWILVRENTGKISKVSLKELMLNCQKYLELAGEIPAQDIAVFRLLQAISVTILERYFADGIKELIEDEDQALDRWSEYWDLGHYPDSVVEEYFRENYKNFWLVSPDGERRFMQTEAAKKGTSYTAAKLVGDLGESANKIRLFQSRSGKEKEEISLDEAARWLLYLNGFDDTSAKASSEYRKNVKDKVSIGAGWLGKLGLIYAKGQNLFESLMLNTILLKDGKDWWPERNEPYYEKTEINDRERNVIQIPQNLASLLTLPSRRIWLDVTDEGKVRGYSLIGGDYFVKENSFSEQNTVWKRADSKKQNLFTPKRHSSSRPLWQDFQILTAPVNNGSKRPGVVEWIAELEDQRMLPENAVVSFIAPTVIYGDKDFFVTDLSTQNITLYANLLTKIGDKLRTTIEGQIEKIDLLAKAAGLFARNVETAAGAGPDQAAREDSKAKATIYSAVNTQFLEWLAPLNPAELKTDSEVLRETEIWEEEAREIAWNFSKKMIKNYRIDAYIGRTVKGKNDSDKGFHYSIPEAESLFRHSVYKIYPRQDELSISAKEEQG